MLCVKVQNGEEIRRIRLEQKSLLFETLRERSFGETSVFEYVGDNERFPVTSQAEFERALSLANASGKTLKLLLINVHSGGGGSRRLIPKRRALSSASSVASSIQSAPAIVSRRPLDEPTCEIPSDSSLEDQISWNQSNAPETENKSAASPDTCSPSNAPIIPSTESDVQVASPPPPPQQDDEDFVRNFPPSPIADADADNGKDEAELESEADLSASASSSSQRAPEKAVDSSYSWRKTWSCSRCTFENAISQRQCDVCAALRPDVVKKLNASGKDNIEIHPDLVEVSPEQEKLLGKEKGKADDVPEKKSNGEPEKEKAGGDNASRKRNASRSQSGDADAPNHALDIVKTFAPLGRLVTKVGRSLFQPIRSSPPPEEESESAADKKGDDVPQSEAEKRSEVGGAASSSPSPPPKEDMEIGNFYFECGRCGKRIKGIRYQCLFCDDFHLCSQCDALDEHEPLHSFIRIRDDRQDPFLGVLARMGISPFVGVQRKPSADEGDNAKEDAAAEAKEDTKDDGNADAAGDEVNEEEDDTSVGVPSVREDPSEEKQSTDAAAADKDSQKSLPQASTSSSSSDASELKLNDSNGDVKEESASESAPSDLAVSESKLDAESSCEEEQIVFSARQVQSPQSDSDRPKSASASASASPSSSPSPRNVVRKAIGSFPPSPPSSPAHAMHSDDEVKEDEVFTAGPSFAASSEVQVVWRIENDGTHAWPHGAMVERLSPEEIVDLELLTQLEQSGLISEDIARTAQIHPRPSGRALSEAMDKVLSSLPVEVQMDVGNTRENMLSKAKGEASPRGPDLICVPSLQPGEQIEMRVALQTPDHPGHYVTHWQMTAPIAVKSNAEKRAGYARYGECMAVPMRVKSEYSLQQETMLAKLADMGYSDRAANIAAFVASDWQLGKVLAQYLQQEHD